METHRQKIYKEWKILTIQTERSVFLLSITCSGIHEEEEVEGILKKVVDDFKKILFSKHGLVDAHVNSQSTNSMNKPAHIQTTQNWAYRMLCRHKFQLQKRIIYIS